MIYSLILNTVNSLVVDSTSNGVIVSSTVREYGVPTKTFSAPFLTETATKQVLNIKWALTNQHDQITRTH